MTPNINNYPRWCKADDLFDFIVSNAYKLVFSEQSYKNYSLNYLEDMHIRHTY